MKNEKIVPVCKVEIIDEKKVKEARKRVRNNNQILKMADVFKLLGEPTRLKIILSLMHSELCVCDLAATINSTVSAVSHQLRLLRNARLIKYKKDGKMVYYSIDDEHINNVILQIKEHIQER